MAAGAYSVLLTAVSEEEPYVNEPRPHAQGLLRDVEGAPWRGFDAGGLHEWPGEVISVCSDEIRRQLRRRRQARTGLLVHLRDAGEQPAEEGRVALEGQRHRTSPGLLRSGQGSRNPASPGLLRFVQGSSDLLFS